MTITEVRHDNQWLTVTHSDGSELRYLGTWLRDNIPSGRHIGGGQRTFDINELPAISITGASHTADSVCVSFGPENLDAVFDEGWLRGFGTHGAGTVEVEAQPVLWDSGLQDSLEYADFPTLIADQVALCSWLTQVRDFGFGLLENVPTVPEAVFDVVDLFGYVRETNYGRLFDVRVEPDPANLAFTSLRIGMHTDNPYRDPVPGLQLLHCLVNESDGGDSLLCDGFHAARLIRDRHRDAFELLAGQPVRFRYLDDHTDLQTVQPLIQTDVLGAVTGIRYNSRSAQAFDMPESIIADYYDAYRLLAETLNRPESLVQFRLDAGQLMVFDNQRVLHGRTAYNQGRRHLQGCYADKDSLRSRIAKLEAAQ